MISIIYTTLPNKKKAKNIVSILLAKKLCSCVNIFKIESMYNCTESKSIKESSEFGVLIKTLKFNKINLISKLEEIHPYNIPCIIEVSNDKCFVNEKYLNWMNETMM